MKIKEEAIKSGMKTMSDDDFQKIQRGLTTIEEVLRVVKEC